MRTCLSRPGGPETSRTLLPRASFSGKPCPRPCGPAPAPLQLAWAPSPCWGPQVPNNRPDHWQAPHLFPQRLLSTLGSPSKAGEPPTLVGLSGVPKASPCATQLEGLGKVPLGLAAPCLQHFSAIPTLTLTCLASGFSSPGSSLVAHRPGHHPEGPLWDSHSHTACPTSWVLMPPDPFSFSFKTAIFSRIMKFIFHGDNEHGKHIQSQFQGERVTLSKRSQSAEFWEGAGRTCCPPPEGHAAKNWPGFVGGGQRPEDKPPREVGPKRHDSRQGLKGDTP